MKILVKVLLSIALLVPAVFLPAAALQTVEAADNTFVDIKKIQRNTDVSNLYVFEDKLITVFRHYADQAALITSYSKTGKMNWEIFENGPLAIAKNKFARVDRSLLFIHSALTGEVLTAVNFPYSVSKIYMNERFIVIANKSNFYVYDTNGNFIMKNAVNVFKGASLVGSNFILQDSTGIYSYNLTARKKAWSMSLEAGSFHNERLLKPIDNVIYAQGIEKRDGTDLQLPKDVLIAINATTGAVLYKKDFGKYEYTWAQANEFGLQAYHETEDVSNFYDTAGTLKMSVKLESEAIQELKRKYPVYASRYNGTLNFVSSQESVYYSRTYADNNFVFSSLKSWNHKGTLIFEKILDEHIFSITTTDSNKLFVAHGNGHGMTNELNKLTVYNANGTLLETIETEYIEQLKADGNTLYGYGGNALYIFKESAPATISNKVTQHSTRVIGTAEAGWKIAVHAGAAAIGTGTADAAGKFSIPIAKQKIGTKLSLVATNTAGTHNVPLILTVVDGNYPDLKLTHWALNEIMYLADDRIIGGYPNGNFQSEKSTTRAEAAKMLAVALNLPVDDVRSGYKDVSDGHWAKNYIAAASKAGLFNGNPDGTFAPDKTLKRSEMAKIISIAYELKASDKSYFKDVSSGYWAKGFISGLYENGITTGYEDQTFQAEKPTSRAEFSVFLARAINKEFH